MLFLLLLELDAAVQGWVSSSSQGWTALPPSVTVVPCAQQHRDSGQHRQGMCWQSLQFWSRDLSIPNSLWVWCSSLDTSTGRGCPAFQFADGETQTICPVGEGPRDSQRCMEQKPGPQAMSHHCTLVSAKARFGEGAVILQVSLCVCPSLRAQFPTAGCCCSLAVGMEHRRHPVAAWVNGRWVRRPGWGFMQPKMLRHVELKSRVAGSHRGCENTAPTHNSVSCSMGRSYQAGPASLLLYSWIYSSAKAAGEEVSGLFYF